MERDAIGAKGLFKDITAFFSILFFFCKCSRSVLQLQMRI